MLCISFGCKSFLTMKKLILYILPFFLFSIQLKANNADTVKVEKEIIEFSGFFRFDYWYDSRQVVDAVDGLFLMYPKKPDYDTDGRDINAAPNVNALAMATRIRANMKMPDLFKAKSNIFIETDFTGLSNIVNVRLRHAYAKFQWEKSSLLVGLTWHPLFINDVFPNVASLNTGAPFQSFNRSPQVTYLQKLGGKFTLSLSAINQSDSRSLGPIPSPNDASSSYLRNGLVPNLNSCLQFSNGKITLGTAIDYKSLRPRLYTSSIIPPIEKHVTKERVNSFTKMVYFKYQEGKFTLRAKGMLGQNLTEHLMLGGYAITNLDSITGKESYSPLNHTFVFGNITYGKDVQVSLFVGYAKNNGASKNLVSNSLIYARGSDIDKLFRVSPSITYTKNKFQISGELEYTAASYGDIDLNDKGKVKNTKETANTRILMVIQYNF